MIRVILCLSSVLSLLLVALGEVSPAMGDTDVTTQPSPAEQKVIRSIQSFDHLRQIGTAILLYANDHDGKYPPDFGSLLVAEELSMSLFICPAAPSSLPANWEKMPVASQSAWVNAHSDYVYLGAKMVSGDNPNAPVAYERDDDEGGRGMYVLLAKGQVVFLTLDDVHRYFGTKAGSERTTTRLPPAPGQPPAIPLITLDEAKAICAESDLSTLRTALEAFEIDNGRFPSSREGLSALVTNPGNLPQWHAYLGGISADPWGHPYVYSCPGSNPGQDFDLFSCGPDGKPGTADDVKPK